ncbi:hypothetical protein JOD82_001887 [Paenibacillus sp. 1182]|nr:hypothetical protein [Paenibacillus sp. 1182]MBP1308867.1 hypothetical protein [Paenibacillus sp. 1182]
MDKVNGMCQWCNQIDDVKNMINDSNFEDFPLWYHESYYERAKDKLE